MKVRILSGSQAGAIVEMAKTEAEANISTGFVEAVVVEPSPALIMEAPTPFEQEPEPKPTEE